MTAMWIILGVLALTALLLLDGRRSKLKHQRWRRENGLENPEGRRDDFKYWPACPECSAPLSCMGRHPFNAVPADRYDFDCQGPVKHRSSFTHKEIVGMQKRRAKELGYA